MTFIFNLLSSYPYIELPFDPMGWFGLVVFLLAISFAIVKLKDLSGSHGSNDWLLFAVLLLLEILSTLFIGFRFPSQNSLSLIDLSILYQPAAVMVFSAIPIVLAGGFLGPFYAVLLGAVSGLLMGLWETHSLFTILEYVGLGLLVSFSIRQHYRSSLFSLLRHPIVSTVLVPLAFIPIFLLSFFLSASGELATRLDFALTQSWPIIIARMVEYVTAGIIAEILYLSRIRGWAPGANLYFPPWDNRLSIKFSLAFFPIFALAFFALLIGDWWTAGIASRKLMEDRLGNLSYIAAESLPYFLETGQNLMMHFANEDLFAASNEEVVNQLSEWVESVPFFSSLVLLDSQGILVEQFPQFNKPLTEQELTAFDVAREGLAAQTLSVNVSNNEHSAQIAFMARIENQEEDFSGVLIGYTDVVSNPFTRPAIEAVRAIEESGGEGWILDEESIVVYHTDPTHIMDRYFGSLPGSKPFYEQSNPGESPRYLYVQTAKGRPWTVVLSVPAVEVQQLSLDIAVPLLMVLVLISIATMTLIQVMTSRVTTNLHTLANKASKIAGGDLEQTLRIEDRDEVGQLAEAIDQMRLGLLSRIEDINSILLVSQGAASGLDAEQGMMPILQACLRKNVSSARAVLFEMASWNTPPKRLITLGAGDLNEKYADLDDQVLELMLGKKQLVIPNCFRSNTFYKNDQFPGALMAFTIQDEKQNYGVLWLAFTRPQQISDQDLRYFSTLSAQASLVVGNASLFRNAEIGRQRLEAILNSSPDPILVFDHELRLLLLNSAASQLPNLIYNEESGAPLEGVLSHKILIEMISRIHQDETITREIMMPEGRTYMASVAGVMASRKEVGKICMLRDISRYKELDTLKSEFVSTVSHDLKFPLSLLKGYSTMLDMVGELNAQQKDFSQKISEGIEHMSQLVDDILDLTRIESSVGLNFTRVNLIEAIEKFVSIIEPHAKQKNIQLILNETVESGISIETDFSLLQQALLNLLENAVKYTPTGGQIEITTRFSEEAVVFEVRDNGMGISPVDVPYIFNKFYRSGDQEAIHKRSTGLGLAIVKSIADRLTGRVWVQSKLGKGSTFYLELPLGYFEQKD